MLFMISELVVGNMGQEGQQNDRLDKACHGLRSLSSKS